MKPETRLKGADSPVPVTPKNVILYSDFVIHCSKYAYPGTVKTVPYELTDTLRVFLYEPLVATTITSLSTLKTSLLNKTPLFIKFPT